MPQGLIVESTISIVEILVVVVVINEKFSRGPDLYV
jgi:hypothetical protein